MIPAGWKLVPLHMDKQLVLDVFLDWNGRADELWVELLKATPVPPLPVEATPAAGWREAGEPDPHGDCYNCERAALCMGELTDDELANGVFMHGNEPLNIEAILSGKPGYHPSIAWLTAAKDRIRWLSRELEKARSTP